ncbi:hypothetical protein MC885_020204 [Smutsia gigantea]|nr:hypothetical protein MC885_020204 [Smutsia gigantea]
MASKRALGLEAGAWALSWALPLSSLQRLKQHLAPGPQVCLQHLLQDPGGLVCRRPPLPVRPPPAVPAPPPLSPASLPCSEHDLGEDIYDCVPCEDEGDDIYEDIIKVEVQRPMVSCCPAHTGPQTRRGTLGLTSKSLCPQGAASPVQREPRRPFSVKPPKETGL